MNYDLRLMINFLIKLFLELSPGEQAELYRKIMATGSDGKATRENGEAGKALVKLFERNEQRFLVEVNWPLDGFAISDRTNVSIGFWGYFKNNLREEDGRFSIDPVPEPEEILIDFT